MRDIDLVVVLTQTDGEYDDEVKQGSTALAQKYEVKQVKVIEMGFTKDGVDASIRAVALPANPKIGVYLISHAFSGVNPFTGSRTRAAIQGVPPEKLAGFISGLLEPISSPLSQPQLTKVF